MKGVSVRDGHPTTHREDTIQITREKEASLKGGCVASATKE
jgi:hypothetical protein